MHAACLTSKTELLEIDIKVYVQRFWMKHWGHPTPKRSILWSPSPCVRIFDRGILRKAPCRQVQNCPNIPGQTRTQQILWQPQLEKDWDSCWPFLYNVWLNCVMVAWPFAPVRIYPPAFAGGVVEMIQPSRDLGRPVLEEAWSLRMYVNLYMYYIYIYIHIPI